MSVSALQAPDEWSPSKESDASAMTDEALIAVFMSRFIVSVTRTSLTTDH